MIIVITNIVIIAIMMMIIIVIIIIIVLLLRGAQYAGCTWTHAGDTHAGTCRGARALEGYAQSPY